MSKIVLAAIAGYAVGSVNFGGHGGPGAGWSFDLTPRAANMSAALISAFLWKGI